MCGRGGGSKSTIHSKSGWEQTWYLFVFKNWRELTANKKKSTIDKRHRKSKVFEKRREEKRLSLEFPRSPVLAKCLFRQ
jgi:hypothetical protein